MKRVVAAALAVVLVVGFAVLAKPMTASAESLYIKKIVSVVYDDSGSMSNYDSPNWAYASYAMQAFCGLLNSDDRLFITYMSDADANPNHVPDEVDLSAFGIQDSIDRIRAHTSEGSTPYSAVDIAMQKLRDTQDSNENTQYWLVVITDGAFQDGSSSISKGELDSKLSSFTNETMPNSTRPQVTYLAIGSGAIMPTHDTEKGIYVYDSAGAGDIVGVMSDIADKVSGRSRLSGTDIRLLDSRTVQVTSDIPLLNIAVLSQRSSAKVTRAYYSNGSPLDIERSVSFAYPSQRGYNTDETLIGGGFLIGNGDDPIEAGTYAFEFDEDVTLDNFVVMFEPALEVRLSVVRNGETLDNLSQLQDSHAGDIISVSYNIYEVGTNNRVSLDLLPSGTTCEVTISENGTVVESATGSTMEINDFELDNCDTRISAAVRITGFNPIEYTAEFTPGEYVPRVVYTISPAFGSDLRSVKLDDISANTDLTVEFSVYADGVLLTSAAEVLALNPQISVSPAGNDGAVEVSPDGKVIFTPNSTTATESAGGGSVDVTVTCTIADASASETYSILLADYEIVVMDAAGSIRKNEFYGNELGPSFYITKDGVKLDRQAVEGAFAVSLNEEHSNLTVSTTVEPDGTIVCIPHDETEHKLTFFNWWINWWRYFFELEGADAVVTLSHTFGSASSTVPVVEATIGYLILNVILPLLIEILVISAAIWYTVTIVNKARFAPNAVLYVGSISYSNVAAGSHMLMLSEEEPLGKYNRGKTLWNPFTEITADVGGFIINPVKGGSIIVQDSSEWYEVRVMPRDGRRRTPAGVFAHNTDRGPLSITEIRADKPLQEESYILDMGDTRYYLMDVEMKDSPMSFGGRKLINHARVICYTSVEDESGI